MRYSKQRELVMQTVQALCDHPTAEEIYDAAVKECPGLSLGTVYRNLNSLVDAGRVRRVSIPGKADRFDHTLPWHSHLYCTVCSDLWENCALPLARNAQRAYTKESFLQRQKKEFRRAGRSFPAEKDGLIGIH